MEKLCTRQALDNLLMALDEGPRAPEQLQRITSDLMAYLAEAYDLPLAVSLKVMSAGD